jgi:ferredoxin-NADP reductase
VQWHAGSVVSLRDETPTARTIELKVPTWPGHVAGQHVDVRLTAADGYAAARSYSIATPPHPTTFALTIERLPDGEVSPYLTTEVTVGDVLEVSNPIGNWFVWRDEQTEPVQLVAGGSGVVPLMAMLRAHAESRSRAPFRLLYSVREPDVEYYKDELHGLGAGEGPGIVTYAYTRAAPTGWGRPPGRIDRTALEDAAWPARAAPTCYVCGPTAFVETVADLLTAAGHEAKNIRTERFGPT